VLESKTARITIQVYTNKATTSLDYIDILAYFVLHLPFFGEHYRRFLRT